MIKKFFLIVFVLFIGIGTNLQVSKANEIGKIDEFDKLDGDARYLAEEHRDSYYLDIEKTGLLETGDKMVNEIANILFAFIKSLALLVVSIFYFAMGFDASALLSGQINGIQSALNNGIFKPLFVVAFAGTSFIIVKRLLRRDVSGIIGDLTKVIGIVVLSYALVNHSAQAMSVCTGITKSISVSALTGLNNQLNMDSNKNSYAATASGVLWINLLHEPWKTLEFNKDEPSDDEVKSFLDKSSNPGSDKRKELIKNFQEKENYDGCFNKTRGGGRVGFILVYLIPFLIKSAIYLIVALVQLIFQLMAIFFLLLAPIVLLLALIPGYEIDIISIWLRKMLETQVSILIITFLMGLLVKIDSLLYDLSGTYGWLPTLVFQTAIAVGLFLGRNKILHAFGGMQKGMRTPGYLKSQMLKAGNIFQGYENYKNKKRPTTRRPAYAGSSSGGSSSERSNNGPTRPYSYDSLAGARETSGTGESGSAPTRPYSQGTSRPAAAEPGSGSMPARPYSQGTSRPAAAESGSRSAPVRPYSQGTSRPAAAEPGSGSMPARPYSQGTFQPAAAEPGTES